MGVVLAARLPVDDVQHALMDVGEVGRGEDLDAVVREAGEVGDLDLPASPHARRRSQWDVASKPCMDGPAFWLSRSVSGCVSWSM